MGKNIFGFILFILIGLRGLSQPEHNWGGFADSIIVVDAIQVEAHQVNQPLKSIPGSISVVSGKGLNLSDGNNMATLLNTLPGITMQSGTYATNRIVIRGMGSRTPYNTNRIRSYLNDVPLTSSDGISTPEEIDLQSLERIEIIKGPSSALYGSGLGGTINLFTPLTKQNIGKANVQTGSFNSLKSNISGSINNGRSSLWGNASHFQTDGYRNNSQYRRTSLLTTGQWHNEKHQVKGTFLYIDSKGQIPSSIGKTLFETDPRAAAVNWINVQGYKATQKALVGLTISSRINPIASNRLTLFGRWNNNYEKRPFNDLDDHSYNVGIRNRLSWHKEKTDWVLGTELFHETYGWALLKDAVLLNENIENRRQVNLFGMLQYRPGQRLNLSIAGAINHISYQLTDRFAGNGDQSGKRNFPLLFSPRLGMNYRYSPSINLYASVGHGFSLPSPEETLLPAGDVNPAIKPEQGVQFEVGSRINLSDNRWYMDVSLYHIELSNLLVTKRISEDIFTGINAGRTRHQGLEFQFIANLLQRETFPGKIQSVLGYTYGHHLFVDFTDDGNSYNGKQLPGIPRQTLQFISIWQPHKSWDIEVNASFNDRQFLNDGNTMSVGSHALLNMKVNYRFNFYSKKIATQLYAGVNNLSNARYASMIVVNAFNTGNAEPRFYYPGMPRHIYFGLTMLFGQVDAQR